MKQASPLRAKAQPSRRAGLRTTTEILELTRDLLQVRGSLNTTTAAAYIAQSRLLTAMGMLEQDHLMPDAENYNAQAHSARAGDNGDIPLITPLVRALDSVTARPMSDRPVRDPAGPLAVEPVKIEN